MRQLEERENGIGESCKEWWKDLDRAKLAFDRKIRQSNCLRRQKNFISIIRIYTQRGREQTYLREDECRDSKSI